MKKGKLVIISGPSGCGKGTIISNLLRMDDNFKLSVSMTTRKPRPGEINGVHYYFVGKDDFRQGILNGDFLEYTEYGGNFYGTPKKEIAEIQDTGADVLLDIEVVGTENVRKTNPDNLITIFLMPPSFGELEKRLSGRGTETRKNITERLERAKEELHYKDDYDYIVVNDDLKRAVNEIYQIIKSEE